MSSQPVEAPRARQWRLPDGEFLVEGPRHPILLSTSAGRVTLPDGSEIDRASEFARLSPTGALLEWYRPPHSSTLDDYLYVVHIHCVLGASLYEFVWSERAFEAGRLEQRLRLRDLRPCAADAVPCDVAALFARLHER